MCKGYDFDEKSVGFPAKSVHERRQVSSASASGVEEVLCSLCPAALIRFGSKAARVDLSQKRTTDDDDGPGSLALENGSPRNIHMRRDGNKGQHSKWWTVQS